MCTCVKMVRGERVYMCKEGEGGTCAHRGRGGGGGAGERRWLCVLTVY